MRSRVHEAAPSRGIHPLARSPPVSWTAMVSMEPLERSGKYSKETLKALSKYQKLVASSPAAGSSRSSF